MLKRAARCPRVIRRVMRAKRQASGTHLRTRTRAYELRERGRRESTVARIRTRWIEHFRENSLRSLIRSGGLLSGCGKWRDNDSRSRRADKKKEMTARRFYFSRNLSPPPSGALVRARAPSPLQPILRRALAKCAAYVNACVPRCHVAAIALVFFFYSCFFFNVKSAKRRICL